MKKPLILLFLTISFFGFCQEKEITDLNKLAEVYKSKEDYSQAAKTYQILLDKIKNNYGDTHKDYNLTLVNLATLYANIEETEKAETLFLQAVKNTKKTLGKNHSDYGSRLNNLAMLYFDTEQYEKALPIVQEALKNIDKNYGREHPDYKTTLFNLIYLCKQNEQYKEVASIYFENIKNIKKTIDTKHNDYSIALEELADFYKEISEFKKEIPVRLDLLQIYDELYGKEHQDYGNTLRRFCFLYDKTKQYDKAVIFYHKYLEFINKTDGIEHSNYWEMLENLFGLYTEMEENEKALQLYLQALENTEKALGKKNVRYVEISRYLGRIYQFPFYNYEKSEHFFLNALENAEKMIGKEHQYYIDVLTELAETYKLTGQTEKAEKIYLEALENTAKTVGKEDLKYGRILSKLADVYSQMGQNNKALDLSISALENARIAVGKKQQNYAARLNGLAMKYLNNRKFKKSITLSIEHLMIIGELYGKKSDDYGKSAVPLAYAYLESGQIEKALTTCLEAKGILKKDNLMYSQLLLLLSKSYAQKGQFEKALPIAKEAIGNVKLFLPKEHSSFAVYLLNLLDLYSKMGLNDKALAVLKELNNSAYYQIKYNFAFQNEKGKETFFKNKLGDRLTKYSEFNYSTNNSYPESISSAINNILTSKGLLLNANKDILSQLSSLNQIEINDKVSFFRSKKSFIDRQQQLPLKKRVTNYEEEYKKYEKLGREITKLYTQHFGEEINYIKDWQKNNLDENEVAIEFTHFNAYNNQGTDSTMYVAYLYKKDWKTPKVVNLFEEKRLTKYFSTTSDPNTLYASRGGIATSTTATLAVADSIYNLVWKPLEKYVASSSTIYFSPDGLLHKIPIAALPNKENKLIGEMYNIQQMGNTADIGTNEKFPNLNDVILIGGVHYDYKVDSTKQKKKFIYNVLESKELLGDTINRSISRNGFDYLKGTEKEIFKIDSLLGNSKQLSGYNATETAFKKLSGKSPSVLHIATHGFFFKKPKEKPKNTQLLDQQNSYRHHENPLLRSGLLFANANYAWQNGNNPYEEDDGILTALEISNLDLKNTDIVILSACETGLGDIEGSEGVYGLQRAFKMAGVKTVIMSLWEVPDAETAEFMNLFYTKWKTLNNPKKAFKEAQQQMMNTYRETPEKWAAFVYFE
jgi:CHAT domain-containing protein